MNPHSFMTKLHSPVMYTTVYEKSYNDFWEWKLGVEVNSSCHILDDEHRDSACERLLNVLPSWQTYRGVKCDYRNWLPFSLSTIANAYDSIREYDIRSFARIPLEPLEFIWHELGRVKTASGYRRERGDYHVISVCKPLMFIWGQTPPFDSINRKAMKLSSYGNSWDFHQWVSTLTGLSSQVIQNAALIGLCEREALRIYGSKQIVPYGRLLDVYYH